jgi:DNA-directed RNA polymerase III subunit RPC6
LVVNTLVYDGRLEEVSSAVLLYTGQSTAKKRYKVCKTGGGMAAWDQLTEIPCGRCPVLNSCSENGVISPATCEYYNDWLNSAQALRQSLVYGESEVDVKQDMSW